MNIMKRIRSTQEGFTLIELLIVIVILGVLAAIIVPRMTNLTARARTSAGESSLRSVYNGLEMYRVEKGSYPGEEGDGDIGAGIEEYIENFTNLDTFLGEWTFDGTAYDGTTVGQARGYSTVGTGEDRTYTIEITHKDDVNLGLLIDSETGTITTP